MTPTADALVPDLRGKTATEAEAALVDVGLRLGRVDSTGVADGVGVVDGQDPAAGTGSRWAARSTSPWPRCSRWSPSPTWWG